MEGQRHTSSEECSVNRGQGRQGRGDKDQKGKWKKLNILLYDCNHGSQRSDAGDP